MPSVLFTKLLILVTSLAVIAGMICYRRSSEHGAMLRAIHRNGKAAEHGVRNLGSALRDYKPK